MCVIVYRQLYVFTGPGLSVLLGTEYERKKQKLQEELQLDYKRYIDQVWWNDSFIHISELWFSYVKFIFFLLNFFFHSEKGSESWAL